MGIFSHLCQKQMESFSITYFSREESLDWLSSKMLQGVNTLILGFAA